MEKRALLAFVLSLAVLVAWEVLTRTPHAPEAPVQPPQATSPPSTAPAEPQPSPGSEPAEVKPPSAFPAEAFTEAPAIPMEEQYATWTVETPLYRARILAPGARVHLFELKRYGETAAKDSPPTELISTRGGGYLPLAMDLLRHSDWSLSTRTFQSDAPARKALAQGDSPYKLRLRAEEPGKFRVDRVFTFNPDSYLVEVETQVVNLASESVSDQLGVSFYFEPYDPDESAYNQSQLSVYRQGGGLEYASVDDILENRTVFSPPLSWAGYHNSYFLQALVPQEGRTFQVVPRVLDKARKLLQVAYITEPFQLGAGESRSVPLKLYMGPKELGELRKAGSHLEEAVDFGWVGFLARPLVYMLKWFYGFTHNYGVAIILLTVVIKIIFWPLTHKSYKSMQGMKKLQPKMTQIREKYKDDREKLNQELMMLYKTHKVNPLGGCLPMALQIPFFFALYRMLYGSVELLHEPFFLWINDLTAPDRLDIGVQIPYLGGLPVLTLLMGASMFIQQKMTPTTGDPRQEKMMPMMPIVFTFFFINFPSGLVLYWLVNNLLSIVQQSWINRRA